MSKGCTFVITNKNLHLYLEECIRSCLEVKKLYPSTKILIIDDGSNDGSKKYLANLKDSDVDILMLSGLGVERALNKALKLVETTYVCRVDADDYLNPHEMAELLKSIQGEDVIYGNYYRIDHKNNISKIYLPGFDKHEIFERGDFLATGTVIKTSAINRINGYKDLKKNCGLENFELILNLIFAGYVFKKVEYFTFYYRVHLNNMSISRYEQINKYGEKLFKNRKMGAYKRGKYHPLNIK